MGDAGVEGTETFTIRLSGATNAVIGVDSALGTILDDDQVAAPCSPRPAVQITTSRSGTDQITVVVKAGSGTITSIGFGSQSSPMQNAIVETIGPGGQIQSFGTYTPPAGVTQASFVVRRLTPNQPIMVNLAIEDGCGQWTTFVGAGATAF
jgi:hypothetical protein